MVKKLGNWIGGKPSFAKLSFEKKSPHNGRVLSKVSRSSSKEIEQAVNQAALAFHEWSITAPVIRGQKLLNFVKKIESSRERIAQIVATETGKSYAMALGETDGAISLGYFFAGEGQRLYGRTVTSSIQNRQSYSVREAIGVAGLIIAANTPVANVAWKIFPALICGNTVVLKAAEDTPETAWVFGFLAKEAGIPAGVLNIVQGFGEEAGAALVSNPRVKVISFTGSSEVGREIAAKTSRRFVKLSLELGGKNPLIVCDDADLDNAIRWTVLSAFSNAGQRCAAGSRIIVFESVYAKFVSKLIAATKRLKLGPKDSDDLGPVINENQMQEILFAIDRAKKDGVKVLVGGRRSSKSVHKKGFYIEPTLIENAKPDQEISKIELFGPVSCLYKVKNFEEALKLANQSPYGLTAAIHTKNHDRIQSFVRQIEAGTVFVNAGTYGSEPHMPFGGVKNSGNGTREPGTEAIEFYSQLKSVNLSFDPSKV